MGARAGTKEGTGVFFFVEQTYFLLDGRGIRKWIRSLEKIGARHVLFIWGESQ